MEWAYFRVFRFKVIDGFFILQNIRIDYWGRKVYWSTEGGHHNRAHLKKMRGGQAPLKGHFLKLYGIKGY